MQVETRTGAVEGEARGDHHAFLGIPYAAAPTGSLRFRPPLPVAPWSGVRPARELGPLAPQLTAEGRPTRRPTSEDCLRVDVRTPPGPGPHPVLVWLHGGAFHSGGAEIGPLFPGWYNGAERLAARGVIVVGVTYRLGALGWLRLPDDDGDPAGSANHGLLDQRLALSWVHDNIERFGGDPDRITLAGQSAGAMAVACHLAEGGIPLSGAVLMSGAADSVRSPEAADAVTAALCRRLGIDDPAALRGVPVGELVAAQHALVLDHAPLVPSAAAMLLFGPVADGRVVTGDPLRSVATGSAAEVAVLVGSNDQDAEVDGGKGFEPSVEDVVAALDHPDAAAVVAAYVEEHDDPRAAVAALASDHAFRLPAIELAEARRDAPAPTYRYQHSWDGVRGGSRHAAQLRLFWDACPEPVVRPLSRLLSSYLVSFVQSGRPHCEDGPDWRPYGPARATLVVDEPAHVVDDPDRSIRRRWGRSARPAGLRSGRRPVPANDGPRDLVTEAAAVLARPRVEPADSFRLHAPLELLARARLLDRLGGDDRAAQQGIEALAARYEGEGTPLAPRPEPDFAGAAEAAAALAAAVDVGTVDEAGDAARWLGRYAGPALLVDLVAPVALDRLTAAGHANIFFQLLSLHPHRSGLGTLLHPLARELARDPTAVVRTSGSTAPVPTDDVTASLQALPLPEAPEAAFIRALVDRAQDAAALTEVRRRLARPADPVEARRRLVRIAQWSMLGEPDEFVPYGWTHGLTLPLAALAVGRLVGAPDDAWEVALAYVIAHRTGLGRRPLEEPALSAPAPEPVGLARRAAGHHDAHVVKYTAACLDLADADPSAADLHLAAAARLLRFWDA